MTADIALTLGILGIAILLFVTEIVRVDLVALGVLVALTLTGLIQPDQALSGFSNPAVVTIWAMFILSAGLARTGIANTIGRHMLRLTGRNEARLVAVIMTVTGLLSAFMNNIAVAALFLPITMDMARSSRKLASHLLLPMAYGSLLGGLVLLIGTPSNLIVRDALLSAGLVPFGIFAFFPGGILILFLSVLYMTLIGRRFLPNRVSPAPLAARNGANTQELRALYGLEERLSTLVLPQDSALAGKTLSESRIGRALGLNVLRIQRQKGYKIPASDSVELEGGDRLLILGRLDRIHELANCPLFIIEDDADVLPRLITEDISLAEFRVTQSSTFTNKTLAEMNMRHKYGVNVLAIRQGETVRRTNFQNIRLSPGDRLLLQGHTRDLEAFRDQTGFHPLGVPDAGEYNLEERLLLISIPPESALVGRSLKESRLGAAYGISVLSVNRDEATWQMPDAARVLQAGDRLVVGGRPTDIDVLRGLSSLVIDHEADLDLEDIESGSMQIMEVMISPYAHLSGKSLRELHFREKYGVSVLAIWRGERAYRTDLGEIPLNYGDALLCFGPVERFELIARDRDFVVLRGEVQEKPRSEKALLSALIMLGVVGSVIFFNAPIAITAIAGVILMVAAGCLTMEEAYQGIDWRSVFLIAAMLPLGVAMQQTGAAVFLADSVIQRVGIYGPTAVLGGLMLLCTVATQVMPSAVVAVLMSPIALSAAANLGISPYAFMMGIAYAIAACLLSPVAHPANVLVMSPGSYRFTDYIKQGLPITLIVLVISVLLLPVLFPY